MRYFSLSGEMSEKLRRCRKELTAAIDRAMEDLSIPFPPSPDPTTDQNSDLLITQPSTPPNTDLFNHKGEPIPPTVCCPQLSPPVSSAPEKENPLFRPSLIPVTVGSNISCTKREPLTSKENTWLHPPIFMADRQFFLSLEDSERWRKGHLRYALLGMGLTSVTVLYVSTWRQVPVVQCYFRVHLCNCSFSLGLTMFYNQGWGMLLVILCLRNISIISSCFALGHRSCVTIINTHTLVM
uniref:Chromosome 3 open reading frame 62 n=1 Tax=Varanus komodoensis TaxID=61221 RepID=A0A8D2Q4P2_VARKO